MHQAMLTSAVACPRALSMLSSKAHARGRARAAAPLLRARGSARAPLTVRAVAVPPLPDLGSPSVEELKAVLLDSLYGTERGLAASSDARAEISELVSQLEARNPTPNPNEAQAQLSGAWRLVYTSNSELIALLALDRLPLVSVGEIMQVVDGEALTVENRIEVQAPLSKTALSATASLEVRSPKLLQVKFEEGRVSTPELVSDVNLPTSIDVLGQVVDLSPLQPLEGPLRSALSQLGSLLAGAPDLQIPLSNSRTSTTWLLNTYLDDTMRITRGDQGSVYVLVKDAPAGMDATGSAGAVAGYYGAASPDWDAIEEQDPPSSGVVEASQVIEGTGSNGTVAGTSSNSGVTNAQAS